MSVPSESLGTELSLLTQLLPAFNDDRNVKIRRAVQAAALGSFAWRSVRKIQSVQHAKKLFTLTVSDMDMIYEPLHGWLLDQMPVDNRHSLKVVTKRHASGFDSISEGRKPAPLVHLLYDGRQRAKINVEGHSVEVTLEYENGTHVDGPMSVRRPSKLILEARSSEGRDAMLDVIRRLVRESSEESPRLYQARFDYWNQRKEVPVRPLETVILRAGQRERLVKDIEKFLASEETYGRLGMPWHRGYVLHGPPGTGKSSIVKALASHFRFDVYFANLSDCKSDGGLSDLVGNVPPRSVLLLEDVDILKAATSREDSQSQATMSSLLNALDGLMTPHGLITVMTTNDIEALDPALLRPGRADLIEHFDYLDGDQASRLAELILGQRIPVCLSRDDLTAAEVSEAAKPHFDDPKALLEAVESILSSKPGRKAA